MPGFDGTGPRGQGPRTGGGWGRCAPLQGEAGAVLGVGRGGVPRGGGMGRCWGGGRGGWGQGRGAWGMAWGRGGGWGRRYAGQPDVTPAPTPEQPK